MVHDRDGSREVGFPRLPGRGRGLLHALITLAGWVVFVWWWWIVLGRVSRGQVEFTVLFIAITTLIAVVVTGLWSAHNKRLHRRLGARSQVREVEEKYETDTLGKPVSLPSQREKLAKASVVEIEVGRYVKVYRDVGAPVETRDKADAKKVKEFVHGLV